MTRFSKILCSSAALVVGLGIAHIALAESARDQAMAIIGAAADANNPDAVQTDAKNATQTPTETLANLDANAGNTNGTTASGLGSLDEIANGVVRNNTPNGTNKVTTLVTVTQDGVDTLADAAKTTTQGSSALDAVNAIEQGAKEAEAATSNATNTLGSLGTTLSNLTNGTGSGTGTTGTGSSSNGLDLNSINNTVNNAAQNAQNSVNNAKNNLANLANSAANSGSSGTGGSTEGSDEKSGEEPPLDINDKRPAGFKQELGTNKSTTNAYNAVQSNTWRNAAGTQTLTGGYTGAHPSSSSSTRSSGTTPSVSPSSSISQLHVDLTNRLDEVNSRLDEINATLNDPLASRMPSQEERLRLEQDSLNNLKSDLENQLSNLEDLADSGDTDVTPVGEHPVTADDGSIEDEGAGASSPGMRVGIYVDPVRVVLAAITPFVQAKTVDEFKNVIIRAAEIGDAMGAIDQTGMNFDGEAGNASTPSAAAEYSIELLQATPIDVARWTSLDFIPPEGTTTNDGGDETDGREVYEAEIKARRMELARQYGNVGTQIAEGMNAISTDFPKRAELLIAEINAAASINYAATIGAASDVAREALIESLRATALSATELGVAASQVLFRADVYAPVKEEAGGSGGSASSTNSNNSNSNNE